MKRLLLIAAVLFMGGRTDAFAPSQRRQALASVEASSSKTALFITSKEILAKARAAAGMPVEDEEPDSPQLFEDDLLVDMQTSLQMLERRVNEGAGALTGHEVMEFEGATQRILIEMKQFLAEGGTTARPATPVAAPAVTAPVKQAPAPAPLAADAAATPSLTPVPVAAPAVTSPVMEAPASAPLPQEEENPNDDGPAYDGTSGFGLAKGTTNTYYLEGMEEMSPEEYRKALQATVSKRQEDRRTGTGGVVGNRAAHQYLDQLGWGGASSNWKHNEEKDEDTKEEKGKKEDPKEGKADSKGVFKTTPPV